MAYKMANNEEVLLTHWKGCNYQFHWFDIFIVMKTAYQSFVLLFPKMSETKTPEKLFRQVVSCVFVL